MTLVRIRRESKTEVRGLPGLDPSQESRTDPS